MLPLTLSLTISLFGIFGTATAQANMLLSNVIVHFEPGKPTRQDVEITNAGTDPMYVDIEPTRVLEPGTENESRVKITDPRADGLLVTPNKMILPPGATKVIRLVKIGAATEERVYRITAKPVAAGVEAEQSGLKIMVGYEILAIVYPNEPLPNLEVARTGQNMVMRNNGNTNILLREGYQCATKDQPLEECDNLPARRLYPGNEWQVDLPQDLPVKFYQSVGTRNFVEEYK